MLSRSAHLRAATWQALSLRCLTSQAAAQLPPCDFVPPPYTGPSKEEVLSLRKRFLSPAIFHHFKDPVMITDGHMQYLYDENGKRYLDVS